MAGEENATSLIDDIVLGVADDNADDATVDQDTNDQDQNTDQNQDQPKEDDQDKTKKDDQPSDDDTSDNDKEQDQDTNKDTDEGDEDAGEDEDKKDENEDDPVVVSLIENSGFEFSDEELEKIDESEEGLQNAVKMISDKQAEQRVQERLGQYEDVQEYLQFREQGGDPNEFFRTKSQEINYENLELQEDDIVSQREVVKDALRQAGYDEEDVNAEVQELEEANKLYNRSQRDLKVLRNRAKQEREQLEQQQAEENRKQKEQQEKIFNEAKQAINNKKLPVGNDEKLLDYVFTPDKEGMTQYQRDISQLSTEQIMTVAALVRNGVDLDGIAEKQGQKKSVQNLRERLRKSKKKGGNQEQNPGDEGDISSVQLDNIDTGN